MKKRLYWILPLILVFIGLGLLFSRNIAHVTEPPESDWSRELLLFETDVNQQPLVTSNADSFHIASYNTNSKLVKKTYNNQIELTNTITFDVPYTKWTKVFVKDDKAIYFDYENINNGETKERIDEATNFYALQDTILYMKGSDLYQLDPETDTPTKIKTFEDNTEEITPFQQGGSIWFIATHSTNNSAQLDVYRLEGQNVELVTQPTFELQSGELLKELSFATKNDKVAFLLETERKNTGGAPPVYTTYLAEGELKDTSFDTRTLTYYDPHSKNPLREAGDATLSYHGENLVILFAANGYSQTKHGETSAFNIYAATFDGEKMIVERRSNTAAISSKPQWIDENSIAWLDLAGDHYKLLYSSSDSKIMEKAKQITGENLMAALGKTLLMAASSFIGYILSSIWFIWPLLFIVVLFLVRKRLLDQDPSWLFYGGALIYLIAAVIFKHRFFVENIYDKGPEYLTFSGSSYVYIFGFALLAYLFSWMGYKRKEWASTTRLFFFVFFHLVLLIVYFGPYMI
ncbi:hypothetical protein KO561_13580 [Radiobacillus kanasensis]|uniref:hypothetical protein n=1 Tax=Radiobacillus kanasensis TaxID=2844358 RepID=UPI001E3BA052|nr:hypothetical protein [Radiobacillus kanasensis]UFT98227.1 hypothetical protein KO561_13580 [Radiobacillus kanasensis]